MYLAGDSSIWVQVEDGEAPKYLGCHEFGDVTAPRGDVTVLYCPDPSGANKFVAVESYQGEPGAVTFQVTSDIQSTTDWLERITGPVDFFVHKGLGKGRRDIFDNWERSFAFLSARLTDEGLTALSARDAAAQGRSGMTFSFSAEALVRLYRLAVTRMTTAATQDLNVVAFCGDDCDDGVAAGAAAATLTADVLTTANGGAAWSAAATDPFAADEEVAAALCFPFGGKNRIMVARGTADGANPAEIAYSDNNGATWTTVNVGSTNGQFFTGPNSLAASDAYNIYAVTSGGFIYRSTDGGASWAAVESGSISASPYNAVGFIDRSTVWVAGDGDIIVRSTSADATSPTFELLTATGSAANLTALDVVSASTAFVGTAGGALYRTDDGGDTWESVGFSGSGAGSVAAVKFVNALVGFIAHNSAGGVGTLLRSIDGGATWQVLTTPTNTGLNSLHACDANTAYAVGNVQGGTAVILKAEPVR